MVDFKMMQRFAPTRCLPIRKNRDEGSGEDDQGSGQDELGSPKVGSRKDNEDRVKQHSMTVKFAKNKKEAPSVTLSGCKS